mgnify:CR=1 FL=1
MITNQQTRSILRLCVALVVVGVYANLSLNLSFAQEIKYEDRIGSNKDFDMCEDFRFQRITKLVSDGKLTQKQGYNIWKRIQSDKAAVKKLFEQAVAANELTQDQVTRLLPLLEMNVTFVESRHGWFGKPKELPSGSFQSGEVSAANRKAVYQRLVAANERGDMYDYDVASIMNQLYAGFDAERASVEEVAIYRAALNPRIAQSGSQARVLKSAQMQRNQSRNQGYGAAEIKIAAPADWIKSLEKPVYSGPQPGEKVPALTAVNLRGEQAGQEFDPVALAGDKLHLMFFVGNSRTFGRFLGQLKKQLQSIEELSKQPWAMSVIVSTDDANNAEKGFSILDQRYPKDLVVALSKDGSAGPPAYGLDKNLTATVIVAKGGKVIHNLPYSGDAFYTQPHILGAIASAMEIDHDTLRKYIDGQAGDAVTAANRLGDQKTRKGFKEKLTPLVQNQTITRAEAVELFRLLGDATALRKKVEEFVESKKLTADAARKLLATKPADETQRRNMNSVKCPVMPSRDANRELFATVQGGKVFFCCKNCLAKFEANPDQYQTAAKQQMALTGQSRKNRDR